MKNLPRIHYWWEKIDSTALAANAVRGWLDRPSNGVFVLVAIPAVGYLTWSRREEIQAELESKLRERERILFHHYGRHWRDHLCDRIRNGVPIEA